MCNIRQIILYPFLFLAVTVLVTASGFGQDYLMDDDEVEAYLEPVKTIDVSSVETGIIDAIHVREGDKVSRGQTLVRLDRSVLEKSREVAKLESEAVGNLKTAKAELELQKRRHAILKGIFEKGHGRSSELERAAADVDVARGRVLRAEEEIAIREKQLAQIEAKLAVRNIVSPIDGIVVEIHKNPGEAVSPTNPVLVTVVNIDELRCVFNVPRYRAAAIKSNQSIALATESHSKIMGKVQWKSPIVNAESETVKVIVRIENPNHSYTSGEHCILRPSRSFASSDDVSEDNRSVSHQTTRGFQNAEK